MAEEQEQASRLLIGDLILDRGKRQITRDNVRLDLPKLSYRLVLTLAQAAPDVVTQDELVEKVWPGRIVSAETITQRIKLVRQALGDDAQNPRYIGLVRGEGYRLLADVEPLPPEEGSIARGLFAELGRRRVLQVALVYAAIAWSITEVVSFLLNALPVFPAWSQALVAIVFVVGFPVAMFLAWRFDVGPGGIKRTEAATAAGRLTIAAASVLLIGATAGLFYLIYPRVLEQAEIDMTQARRPFSGIPAPNTIAVLPFGNASEHQDDLYMSEGLGDELRDQLGRVAGLRVAARSSSVIFRNPEIDAIAISDRLGVAKLIEGTLRRQEDQLRITVQIIDGDTGFQDWTQSYDRAAGDLLAVQQEIALEVVRRLLPEQDDTLAATVPATLNASAHELMLLARHHYQQVRDSPVVDLDLLLRAIDLYRQATVVDPESALAHSRLGAALLYLGDVEGAEEPIFRALTIDPDISEVQYTLGLYYWLRHLPGSGDAHRRAVELNPNNADALDAYAKWIWHQQITDEAEPYFVHALEVDPMSISRYLNLGVFYASSGKREETLAVAQQIPARFNDANSFLDLARLHELIGDLDVAIAWALKSREMDPDFQAADWMLAELYARIGDSEGAKHFQPEPDFARLYYERRYEEFIDLVEELVIDQPNQIQLWYGLGRAYLVTGSYDQAIYVLQSNGLPENAFVDSRRANGMEALVTLADALDAIGDVERAHEYADWLIPKFQSLIDTGAPKAWWPHLYLGCLYSIRGDEAQSLDSLERVLDSPGLPWYPVLKDHRCFRKFAAETRYQLVVSTIEARMALLRERLPDTLVMFQIVPQ